MGGVSAAAFAGLAAALLSGCIFGECGFTPDSATWLDQELFLAMPTPGSLPGYEVAWTSPPPGLPFNRTIDPAWGPHNLTWVQWAPGEQALGFEVDDVGFLRATRGNWSDPAAFEGLLAGFLANVSAAPQADREAAAHRILETAQDDPGYLSIDDEGNVRGHSVVYEGALPRPLRLTDLYRDLESSPALETHGTNVYADGWLFAFALPTKSLAKDFGAHGGFRLSVDPRGEAVFDGLQQGEQAEGRYKSRVMATLESLGLPTPRPDEMQTGGTIC